MSSVKPIVFSQHRNHICCKLWNRHHSLNAFASNGSRPDKFPFRRTCFVPGVCSDHKVLAVGVTVIDTRFSHTIVPVDLYPFSVDFECHIDRLDTLLVFSLCNIKFHY